MRNLIYFNCCVNWPHNDVNAVGGLCDMIDSGRNISRRTFLQHVDRDSYEELERFLGYPCGKLTLARDWAVSYYKGKLHRQEVVWIEHSACEYVFSTVTKRMKTG